MRDGYLSQSIRYSVVSLELPGARKTPKKNEKLKQNRSNIPFSLSMAILLLYDREEISACGTPF